MAGKTAVKAGKAPTPAAVKAKGAAAMPKNVEDAANALIPIIKTTALSVDVGPKVIALVAARARDKTQVEELQKSIRTKEYDALSGLTGGIVKAALADKSINLPVVFSGSKLDKAKLNNQLGIALGFRSVHVKGKDGVEKRRVGWSPAVAPHVEPEKSDPEDIKRQKNTVRSNFSHMLTKCIQAAIGIIDDGMKATMDKTTGTLMISGPAVQSRFGAPSVLLNEKQKQPKLDKKGNIVGETALKVKPSFTEVARRAAEAHGKPLAKRVDSRVSSQDPEKHLVDLCAMLVRALEGLAKSGTDPSEKVTKALESVSSAIDEVVG